jgi:hypothetical protein
MIRKNLFKEVFIYLEFIGNNDDEDDGNEISKKVKFERINPDIPEEYEKYTFSLKKSGHEGDYLTKLRLIVVLPVIRMKSYLTYL